MSSQRGNVRKKAPKYQNTFAFQHNPKSKKTAKILSSPITGVCARCFEQIAWRKKYRKYKPLTQPSVCIYCHERSVLSAYHQACRSCARERDICAKCCQSREHSVDAAGNAEKQEYDINVEDMKERERRTFLRKLKSDKTNSNSAPCDTMDMEIT